MSSLQTTAPMLAESLQKVRERAGRVSLWTGSLYAVPVLLLWLALEVSLDFAFDLPRWARALFFLGGVGGAGWVFWRFGLRDYLHPQSDVKVALRIEKALPQFRSRVIASVQLSATDFSQNSPQLVAALLRETAEMAGRADLRNVITTSHLRKWRNGVAIALVLCIAAGFIFRATAGPLLLRALLVNAPLPRKTQIVSWTGDCILAQGDDLRLELTAAGELPQQGTIEIHSEGKTVSKFTLDADPANPARFYRVLSALQDSFSYTIRIGDNRTPRRTVNVRPRPVLLGTEYTQQWPSYTKRPPQPRAATDLKLLAGSTLRVRIKPSVPLSVASLLLVGEDRKTTQKTVMMKPDGEWWTGAAKIPVKDVAGLSFHLADTAGVESRSMAVVPVTIVPDQPPAIQVTWPLRREELVTSRALLLVAFSAKDDFGLAGVRLHFAVNWSEGAPHRTLDLDLGSEAPRNLNRRFEWHLDKLQPALKEGDVIDYWFEARDNNSETGPGVTKIPDHYQVRVVSEDEKRADLSARLNDAINGLNDVRQTQEELSKNLGDLINALPRR